MPEPIGGIEVPEEAVEEVYAHSPGSGPSWQGLGTAAKRGWREALAAALPAIEAEIRERLRQTLPENEAAQEAVGRLLHGGPNLGPGQTAFDYLDGEELNWLLEDARKCIQAALDTALSGGGSEETKRLAAEFDKPASWECLNG